MKIFEDILFSWGTVYVAVTLPAVLLIFNFIVGNCFLREALSQAQFCETSRGSYRIIERVIVGIVLLSFIWQYYVVMFLSRETSVGSCNPPAYFLHLFNMIAWGRKDDSWGQVFLCSAGEGCFLLLWPLHLLFYLSNVMSTPQVRRDSTKTSFCRKCGACVENMDHHCLVIGNCVGSRNRHLFFCLLGTSFLNMLFLLYSHGRWALLKGGPGIFLGFLLVVCFALASFFLLLFQWCLAQKGKTTVVFLKEKRRRNVRILQALFDLIK